MTERTLEIQKQDAQTAEVVERTHPRRRFIPRVDVFENDEAVYLTIDMPGVGEDSLDLTLEKNILTVRGEIEEILPEQYHLTRREYRVGDYIRTFALSDDVNRDNIEALMKNGVLRLTLPKAEQAKARKIEVRTE